MCVVFPKKFKNLDTLEPQLYWGYIGIMENKMETIGIIGVI